MSSTMKALTRTPLLAGISVPFAIASCAPHTLCSCYGIGGLLLHARAGAVSAIRLGGEACPDAQLRCVPMGFSAQFVAGCDEYQVLPRRGGRCVVHVDSVSGASFDTSVDMVDEGAGCCGGVHSTGDPDVAIPFDARGDASAE